MKCITEIVISAIGKIWSHALAAEKVLKKKIFPNFLKLGKNTQNNTITKTIKQSKMEFKGTRGPWEAKEIENEYGAFFKVAAEKVSICNIVTRNITEAEANAKLIAAAPDMLVALNALMTCYEEKGQLLSFDVNIAREAIKKATE